MSVYGEWKAGWVDAAIDNSHQTRRAPTGTPDHKRGYEDYWQHKKDHPTLHGDWDIINEVPAATRQLCAGAVTPPSPAARALALDVAEGRS